MKTMSEELAEKQRVSNDKRERLAVGRSYPTIHQAITALGEKGFKPVSPNSYRAVIDHVAYDASLKVAPSSRTIVTISRSKKEGNDGPPTSKPRDDDLHIEDSERKEPPVLT